jgi:hypothetical protein
LNPLLFANCSSSLIEELCRGEEGIMHAERALKRMSLSENIWWWKYARDKRRTDYRIPAGN